MLLPADLFIILTVTVGIPSFECLAVCLFCVRRVWLGSDFPYFQTVLQQAALPPFYSFVCVRMYSDGIAVTFPHVDCVLCSVTPPAMAPCSVSSPVKETHRRPSGKLGL